jgi:hypothetical protein
LDRGFLIEVVMKPALGPINDTSVFIGAGSAETVPPLKTAISTPKAVSEANAAQSCVTITGVDSNWCV